MTSGQIVGKMNTQKQLNVPFESGRCVRKLQMFWSLGMFTLGFVISSMNSYFRSALIASVPGKRREAVFRLVPLHSVSL